MLVGTKIVLEFLLVVIVNQLYILITQKSVVVVSHSNVNTHLPDMFSISFIHCRIVIKKSSYRFPELINPTFVELSLPDFKRTLIYVKKIKNLTLS